MPSDIRIADENDDWTCTILLPEDIIVLHLPSCIWDQFGCIVSRLTCHDHLIEIAPLIPWVVNTIIWESILVTVYNMDSDVSDMLDEWQISDLEAYKLFNFDGIFIYFSGRAIELLQERRREMDEVLLS